MMMKTLMVAAALCAMSASALADGTYEFDKITKIGGNTTTGILVNETTPTALTVYTNYCGEMILLMMTHPGMFTLSVDVVTQSGGPAPPFTVMNNCQLTAKT